MAGHHREVRPEGSTVDVADRDRARRRREHAPRRRRPDQRRTSPALPRKSSRLGTEAQPVSQVPRGSESRFLADSDGDGRGEVEDAETLRLTRPSPVVRRLAEEHGVEIEEIPAREPGDAITRKDIEGYIEEGEREDRAPDTGRGPSTGA